MYKLWIISRRTGYTGDAEEADLDYIDCGDDGRGIRFDISIPDIDQWSSGEESYWELVNSASGLLCQPATFTGTGLVQYGPFDADQCAKAITTNGDQMEVVFEVDAGTSDGEITFQYEHHYEITCSYLRVNMLQASFLPLHSVSSDDTGKW